MKLKTFTRDLFFAAALLSAAAGPASAAGEKMPSIHANIVGLTGSAAQLERAYDAFRGRPKAVETEWNGTAVISHASFIYFIGPDGRFRTLMPPILPPDSMAEIIGRYLDAPAEAAAAKETSG